MILREVDRLTTGARPDCAPAAEELAALLSPLGSPGWTVDLVWVEDDAIARLNGDYRGAGETTDVLSFSYLAEAGEGSPDLAVGRGWAAKPLWRESTDAEADEPVGEIVVAPGFVIRRCLERGWDPSAEMALLAVHGGLHILGWEHGDAAASAAMRRAEAEVLERRGRPHPLLEKEG